MTIGRGGLVEGECAIDDRFEAICGDRRVHAFEMPARADENAVHAGLFAEQPVGTARGADPGQHADQGNSPADRHRGDGAAQRAGAADLEHVVDAAPFGELQHFTFPLGVGPIIDARGRRRARVRGLELLIAG